jgi:type I restriction enzyme R subunit
LREVPYLEYAREAIGHLCPDVEQLRQRWLQPETRAEVEELLGNAGVDLAELGAALNVPDSDPLDVLVRALFRQPVPTRRDRADRLRREHAAWLDTFAAPAREVLEVILDKYAVGDADDVADTGLLRVPPLSERGTFMELARRFGGGAALRQALAELKRRLY